MSSPADRGPQSSGRDLRPDPGDASVTAAMPAVTDAGSGSNGPGSNGSGPHGSNGSASHGSGSGSNGAPRPAEDWSAPATSGVPDHSRTAAVPRVGGAGTGPVYRPGATGGPAYRPAAASPADAAAARAAATYPAGATTTLPPRPGERRPEDASRPPAAPAAAPAPRRTPRPGAPVPARRAQLTLRRFNVWSVFKFSCMLAIALWLVWMIAIGVLYGILDGSGVVGSINQAWATLQGDSSDAIIRSSQVLGIAAIVGVVYIVLFIALSSIFAVIYNLVSDFVGGVEVTLSERE